MRFTSTLTMTLLLATAQCGRAQDPTPAPVAAPAEAKAAQRLPIDGLPLVGRADGLVTILEFTDYQCPYCARAEGHLAALRAEYGDELRVAIAAHPLPMHDRARPAALAALAADEQGKLAAMHARLFADPKALDDEGLRRTAAEVGLDVARWDAARRGPAVAATLERSEALGRANGVKGTPTFFVNGRRIVGAQPLETFRAIVGEELAKARALVASGVRREDVYARALAAPAADAPSADSCGDKDCQGGPSAPAADAPRVDVKIDGAPLRGFARAPVTLVVFADFECPFSARHDATLRDVERAYDGKVRVAFKHRPLPMHPHARLAAKAALAAQAQGKFWEYHDALFAHAGQDGALDRASLDRYAKDVGLDAARFARDLDGAELDARLAADEADAKALGVEGTPSSFVNGRLVVGAQPLATLQAAIDRALAER